MGREHNYHRIYWAGAAMAMQIDDRGMRGLIIDDAGFDAGQKADWLRANVELSLRGSDSADVAAMLKAALTANGF